MSNSDVVADVAERLGFVGPESLEGEKGGWEDWRNHVPVILMDLWPDLTRREQALIFLCAQAVTHWKEPGTGIEADNEFVQGLIKGSQKFEFREVGCVRGSEILESPDMWRRCEPGKVVALVCLLSHEVIDPAKHEQVMSAVRDLL